MNTAASSSRTAACFLLVAVSMASGQTPSGSRGRMEVTTTSGTAAEREAKTQLERLLKSYKIDQWMFTREIVVNDRDFIPHSHPQLTLNSRYLKDDLAQLSTLVHEQFHWIDGRFDKAIAAFRVQYPDAPDGGPTGARDKDSAYLHLVVCDLEFQAMTDLVGEKEARRVLSGWKHYSWIYDKVLNDPAVRKTNAENGLIVAKLTR